MPKQPDGAVHLMVQRGHLGCDCIAYSHDGKQVLTGGRNQFAILWETSTGRELRRFQGHSADVRAVACSPDGKQVLTGGEDKTARIWDSVTGQQRQLFRWQGDNIRLVAFSGDGTSVVTVSSPNFIQVWNARTGEELRRFQPNLIGFESAAIAVDGKHLLTGGCDLMKGFDYLAILWDVATGQEVRRFQGGHEESVSTVALSSDGKRVLTGDRKKTAVLWDADTGRELRRLEGLTGEVTAAAFTPDGKGVVTGGGFMDEAAVLWEVETGRALRRFKGQYAVTFSADGTWLLTGGKPVPRLWEVASGKEAARFETQTVLVFAAAFSTDGRFLSTGGADRTAVLWDASSGRELRRFQGHTGTVSAVAFARDGQRLLTGSWDKTAVLWDAVTGRLLQRFQGHTGAVNAVALSPDGKWALTGAEDKTARLWNTFTGEEQWRVEASSSSSDTVVYAPVNSVAFAPDGKWVLLGASQRADDANNYRAPTRIWDTVTGKEVRAFQGMKKKGDFLYEGTNSVSAVAISPNGKRLLTAVSGTVRLWDGDTGQELRVFQAAMGSIRSIAFSADGKRVLASQGRTAILWDADSGRLLQRFEGHEDTITSAAFSPDGTRGLTASFDFTARLWDVATGKELCRLISFRNGTWAVTDAQGRYDAANGGDVEGLHWVVGRESIALKQLMERYYDPGLLAKLLGFSKEPLRQVEAFTNPRLFPDLRIADTKGTTFTLDVTNRGGGIGKVQVFVNGKELLGDARGPMLNPDADKATVSVDIANAPSLKPGTDNIIEVVTWNAEGYLSSRGLKRLYTDAGKQDEYSPELYAIVVGVSDYASPGLKLNYSAKDAEDFAKGLELGAKRLFGADKVHLTLLTTSKHPKALFPTRSNIEKAFLDARRARPGDVLIVYLAGHGIALQSGSDLYCYLTQEARSTDAGVLSDPAILRQYAITSFELTEWLNKTHPNKRVIILDTCAAGAAVKTMTEQRNVTGDQIRAIERLKDRTGFHILMGCAADKVSYEATQYQQGLLTHALLKGMRGAALKDEYVDVSTLFQYAADQVPELARHIGGIQKPLIATQRGAASFDVGRLTADDKAAIPLALKKPLLLRPLLINPDEADDHLRLMPLLRKRFHEANYATPRHGGAAVYVDADEMPGGIRPTGTYTVSGDKVQVRLLLKQDGKTLTTLNVSGDRMQLDALVQSMVEAISEEMAKSDAH